MGWSIQSRPVTGEAMFGVDYVIAVQELNQHPLQPAPQNQIQEPAFSVLIVPGMQFLVFEFAAYAMSVPHFAPAYAMSVPHFDPAYDMSVPDIA
eukprot:151581-Rhodomonas_salina.2